MVPAKPRVFVEPSNFFLFDTKFSGFAGRARLFSNTAGDSETISSTSSGPGGLSGGGLTSTGVSLGGGTNTVQENRAPIANIGSVANITLPTDTITLNGSLSSDPDGDQMDYYWSQISGPSAAVITNSSKNIATARLMSAGTFTFNLTVTDSKGATGNAQVSVTVNPTPAGQPMFGVQSASLYPGTTQTTVTTTTVGPAASTLPGNMPNGTPAVLGGGGMMGGGGGETSGSGDSGSGAGASATGSEKIFGRITKQNLKWWGIGAVAVVAAVWKRKAIIEFVKHL